MRLRSLLYRSARVLGDVEAISSGNPERIAKRAGRKIIWRFIGGLIGRILR